MADKLEPTISVRKLNDLIGYNCAPLTELSVEDLRRIRNNCKFIELVPDLLHSLTEQEQELVDTISKQCSIVLKGKYNLEK